MTFQPDSNEIRWKVHFSSDKDAVFETLTTDHGRASFWAESAREVDGRINFQFIDHPPVTAKILEKSYPQVFTVEYFGAIVQFSLEEDGQGGTDLTLISRGVPVEEWSEVLSGWVSVLMNMKAAVDHGIDLRNHDRLRSWSKGYAEN
jgi:hypothetical protein